MENHPPPLHPPPPLRRPTVLDACSLLNLYAAGPVLEDLTALGVKLYITDQVGGEALFIRRGGSGEASRIQVRCERLVATGVLIGAGSLSDLEQELMVGLVAEGLHDGEASSAAVAECRGWTLLTDDGPARRVVSRRGGVSLITSPEVLYYWSRARKLSPSELGQALDRMERCACYKPPREHPLRGWWEASIVRR